MPYNKTVWKPGTAPGISADRLNNLETQYDQAMADVAAAYLQRAGDSMLGTLHLSNSLGRQLVCRQWGDLSVNDGGDVLLGQNCYLHPSDGTFRYANTHPTIGARGILIDWGPNKAYWFDMGSIPTTKDQAFSPTLREIATLDANGRVSAATVADTLGGMSIYEVLVRTQVVCELNHAFGQYAKIVAAVGNYIFVWEETTTTWKKVNLLNGAVAVLAALPSVDVRKFVKTGPDRISVFWASGKNGYVSHYTISTNTWSSSVTIETSQYDQGVSGDMCWDGANKIYLAVLNKSSSSAYVFRLYELDIPSGVVTQRYAPASSASTAQAAICLLNNVLYFNDKGNKFLTTVGVWTVQQWNQGPVGTSWGDNRIFFGTAILTPTGAYLIPELPTGYVVEGHYAYSWGPSLQLAPSDAAQRSIARYMLPV